MEAQALRHRLLAVLAADAVGYSRLMASNDRETVHALDAARRVFRERTASAGGRVVDTAGDSVLAVFDSAVGAVTAAMSAQRELRELAGQVAPERRLTFRMGLHLGDVLEKADGSVYGDGVNVAARLQALAESGEISLSEPIRTVVKGKVEADFEDRGIQHPRNVPEPIRVFRLVPWTAPGSPSSADAAAQPALSLPEKPSIAVLAFTNLSGDADQEHFTDGITEDIITELARFDGLFVIARNSSFTYKGRSVNVQQVGRELGVRYVLEGSIRKTSTRIRVTAQLIDSRTGFHVWAEKYDRSLEDIFEVQESVTECIVGAIAPQIDASELRRARHRPSDLSAYELAVRAMAHAADGHLKPDVGSRDEALRLARLALARDNGSVRALYAIAFAQWQHVAFRTSSDRGASWSEGMDAANRGIALAGSSACHMAKALLLAFAPGGGRWDEARIEADLAWRANPQDSVTLTGCGLVLAISGDPDEAIRLLERALRINPRDPQTYITHSNLARAHFAIGEYEQGLKWARRTTNAAPEFFDGFLQTAALYVGLGDREKAAAAMARARALAPELTKFSRPQKEPTEPTGASDDGSEYRRRYQKFLRVAAGLED